MKLIWNQYLSEGDSLSLFLVLQYLFFSTNLVNYFWPLMIEHTYNLPSV